MKKKFYSIDTGGTSYERFRLVVVLAQFDLDAEVLVHVEAAHHRLFLSVVGLLSTF